MAGVRSDGSAFKHKQFGLASGWVDQWSGQSQQGLRNWLPQKLTLSSLTPNKCFSPTP